ncbi:hypothetical protein EX30DRAFT_201039 [Ascodesmis nigricans]|uniref:ER membrane protein complex subunit 7 beta-sandwich domain-containing protein n=1 Tax=Ascodesmis nigricans TaxID=341454 RepID=A0A4S2MQ78_9PEZI|nr:hypothetical protein EX30DRAFT_201039 [Ascodesmis nigricans]
MNPHPPLPRLLLLPLLLTLLLLSTTVAASQPPSKTKIISLWPLTSPSPTPWVEITLPSSGGKAEYTVLSQESEQEEKGENGGLEGLVRVGWVDDGKWTGVVRRGKDLAATSHPHLLLDVDYTGSVWAVDITSSPGATPGAASGDGKQRGVVEIRKPRTGETPVLNRPVVLDAHGKVPVVEVEKGFLQKYWWLLLGGAVLLVGSAGAPEE